MRPSRFAVLLTVLAASLARVAFVESHWDEDACVAIGWLLSKGWRLYGDVFSHHTPLDYLPASILSSMFGPSPFAARAFMVALWAALCAGLFAALRRHKDGAFAAALFAVLSSQWLTFWHGQMMLVENLWSWAAVSALALLGGPLGLEPDPSPRRAAVIGALLAVILTASPVCLPVVFLLALWAGADPRWRPHATRFALGAACWLVAFGAWAAWRSDLNLLWLHAITFNREVYARFHGFDGGAESGFWRRAAEHNAAYFSTAFDWGTLERYFEGVLKLTAMGWAAWSFAERKWAHGFWKLAFVFAVNSRPEKSFGATPFHAAPFYLTATIVAASALARSWGALSGRPRIIFGAVAAAVLLPTLGATSLATESLRKHAKANTGYDAIAKAVRGCTAPEDRVAAFPFYPRFYLDTNRLPSTPSVFYLPWQDAWEPQRAATMAALAKNPPKAVLIQDAAVWGAPWKEYGAGVNAWLADQGYAPVSAVDGGGAATLLLRPDAASEFSSCAEKSR